MDPAYAAEYRTIYDNHWWWRARESYLVERLSRLCPKGGFGPILDVGCGDGLFFEKLRGFGEPEGVEPDASLVTSEGSRWGHIHAGPFDETFRPEKRYGLILLLDVLEHLDNPESAVARAADLLEPGGRLVVTVPAFRILWTRHDDLNRHRTRYTRRRLASLLTGGPLHVDDCRYFFFWTFPAKLLVRAKEWLMPGAPRPPAIPPPLVNQTLMILSRAEHRLVGWLPVPFGSSLLAVATRLRRGQA
ncbi:MAG: class I SAM-dependent methyltransferase [Planctomycetes bacterium]|nr:class I SAM-dependent methyltransferase [Planctomycetota bacterium]